MTTNEARKVGWVDGGAMVLSAKEQKAGRDGYRMQPILQAVLCPMWGLNIVGFPFMAWLPR